MMDARGTKAPAEGPDFTFKQTPGRTSLTVLRSDQLPTETRGQPDGLSSDFMSPV